MSGEHHDLSGLIREPLPALLDRRPLAAELGCSRQVVDAIFRALPVVVFPHAPRKAHVCRADVEQLIRESTYDGTTRVRP